MNSNIKNALKLLGYFLFFTILYVVAGSSLSGGSIVIRLIANILVLVVCGGVMYTNGANLGDGEVALGEIVHARLEEGKAVDEKDKKQSFRNVRGLIIFLLAIVPILLITVPAALTAEKQMYALQSLPSWVDSYQGHDEIYAPLDYYRTADRTGLMDILQLLSRLLVYPFICMVGTDNLDMLLLVVYPSGVTRLSVWGIVAQVVMSGVSIMGSRLLVDRLAPVLAVLPGIAYVAGYQMGPYLRARVHGDIARNIRKQKKKQKKQIQARREQSEKKNELI